MTLIAQNLSDTECYFPDLSESVSKLTLTEPNGVA